MKLTKQNIVDILLNDSLTAIILTDEKGEILFINKEAEKIFGYTHEKLQGQSVNILLKKNQQAKHTSDMSDYSAHPESRIMGQGREVIAIHKSGKEVPVEVGLRPIHTDSGLMIMCGIIDISIRKANEERIRDLEQIRSRFFMNISHEFKTPLTLVLGPLENLINKSNDEEDLENLSLIKRNVFELSILIDQLLEQSDIDFHRKNLKVSAYNLKSFIDGFIAGAGINKEKQNIAVNSAISSDNERVYFSGEILEKVLHILFKIILSAKPKDKVVKFSYGLKNNVILLSANCDSPQISPDLLKPLLSNEIYIPSKAGGSLSREFSLIYELVLFHRGKLELVNKSESGVEIRISVPCSIESYSSGEISEHEIYEAPISDLGYVVSSSQVSLIKQETQVSDNDKKIILLVEDMTDMHSFLFNVLRSKYNIISAYNGKEGVDKAFEIIPDLIISDIMMPLMNGVELCKIIKNDLRTIHIPVILLTAKSRLDDKIEGLEAGADDYLYKPFYARELNSRIENLLNSRDILRKQFKEMVVIKPSQITTNSVDEQFLINLMNIIEANLGDENFGVDQLSEKIMLSQSQLYRKLISLTGNSPSSFIQSVRLKRAAEMIQKNTGTIAEIAYQVGFGSPAYFSKCFKEHFNCTPRQFPQR